MNDSIMAASLSPGSGVNGVSNNENASIMTMTNNSNANSINGTNSNIMNNDLPPMIFRSMSDASAIRRQQQLQQQQLQQNLNNLSFHHLRNINNNNSNNQNNIHFGTPWIEQQHRHTNNNNLLNHLISPSDGLSQRLFLNNTAQQQSSLSSSSPLSSMFPNGKNIINNKQSNSCDQMMVANSNHNLMNGNFKPFNSVVAGNKSSANTTANAVNIPNGGGNNSVAAGTLSPTNEDDYDLNLVFDEIGALQMKGLNEQEDDNSTAPLQLPSPRSLSLPGASVGNNISIPNPGMLNTMMSQQYDSSKQSTTANNTMAAAENSQKPMAMIEVDKKTYKYDPEIYDSIDITLANEKYSLNARYLRDFRCEQCPQFLQHKCTQHKPFTCFDWHFANQRRRRPLRKKDGTFNYSPDIYCTKYDDTTGICPDGDDCPYLHRTAGDTERRYHLRYYKTGMCVYETDSRGYCVKNGAHCAFAHGSHDLRMAVFDVREQVQMAGNGNGAANNGNGGGDQVDGTVNNKDGNNNNHHHCNGTNGGSTSGNGGCSGAGHAANSATACGGLACYLFDKDRNAVHEDPRWQNTAFVLAYYKTDICKRPPRLCRQGYACPQYHNNKDRRRSPKKFKYRSTPCPSVKQGDEWGDPSNCENKDECTYCHTRTEQQFHPEIYKSTKCNDVQQSGHCPRGPFCAFAHAENTDEINAAREFSMDPNIELPPSISGATLGGSNNGKPTNGHIHSQTSPLEIVRANSYSRSSSANNQNGLTMIASSLPEHCEFGNFDLNKAQQSMAHPDLSNTGLHSNSGSNIANSANNTNNNLGPIARPRSFSTSNTTKTMSAMPSLGSWLDKNNPLFPGNSKALKNGQPQSATASSSSLFHSSSDNNAAPVTIPLSQPQQQQQQQQQQLNASAPFGASLYGASDSVGSNPVISAVTSAAVIDTILNHHDLSFDELDNLVNNQHHHPKQNENLHLLDATTANNSVDALSSMLRHSSLLNESEPINIPSHRMGSGEMRSTSATGFNISPPNHMSSTAAAAASPLYLNAANRQQSLPNGSGGSLFDQFNGGGGPTPTNSLTTSNQQHGYMAAFMEMQRLKEENDMLKNRLTECQDKIQQVFRVCQFEINEAIKKEKMAEKTRDEALNRLNNTQKELESNVLQKLVSTNYLSSMNCSQLLQLKQKLSQNLSLVEEALKIQSG